VAVYPPNPANAARVGSPIARLANMAVPDLDEFRNITWPIDVVVASMAALFVAVMEMFWLACVFLSSSCSDFGNELLLNNVLDGEQL